MYPTKSSEEAAAIKAAKKLFKKNSSSSPLKLKQLVKDVVSKIDGDNDDSKSIKKWIKKSDKFDVSECGKYVSLVGPDKAKGSSDTKEHKKRKRDANVEGEESKKPVKEKKSKKGKETGAVHAADGDSKDTSLIVDAPYIDDLDGPGAIHSALDFDKTRSTSDTGGDSKADNGDEDPGKGLTTLCLFYQYVEPLWDVPTYHAAKAFVETAGEKHGITGRMRVAREGLNCTLTGSYHGIRAWCRDLRTFGDRDEFKRTEFKLTDHLPRGQHFPKLHAFEVTEIVNYGLGGSKAPPIGKTGVHLEPEDYHAKMGEKDTVIIDVRNHYEANIGKFVPPKEGAQYIDPNMRKSTEFPVWLDKPETKEMLKGKQVLMYCTGGVRCERASALLRHKIETEDDVADLRIKGVYQLQGGIDKYFKHFPDGGNWAGKNYVFDKRFAHAPPGKEGKERAQETEELCMGSCESCNKPWDKYRGKRRCPTCGVPSLICYDCFKADQDGKRKLGREIRCDLCIQEGITSKRQIREKEQRELDAYERKLKEKDRKLGVTTSGHKVGEFTDDGGLDGANYTGEVKPAPNPEGITRLFLKNMCNRSMDEATLVNFCPGITHIQWLTDWQTGKFLGSAFVEMATPEDAAYAVGMNGLYVLNRPIKIMYQKNDGKDVWPPEGSEVGQGQQVVEQE